MGDILHALPAITALRKAHPGWQIDWAVEPQWAPLLAAEDASSEDARGPQKPLVDRIFVVPAKEWSRRPFHKQTLNEIRALRSTLRETPYDAVVDLQGSVRSGVVARFAGCRRIIGEAVPRETPARWLFTERVETAGEHVIEQDIELAQAIAGDALEYLPAALPEDQAAEEWCDDLLDDVLLAGRTTAPLLLIHPGAGWGSKRWPADRYGAVAEDFVLRGGVSLVSAGPGEEALAASVVEHARGQAIAVPCTIAQLIALTRRVSLVIGGDTGPMHLACALQRPVVGIYGPTDPKRNGPYGTPYVVLRNPDSRRDHTRREEPEAGLLTIYPQAVMNAVVELLLQVRAAQERKAQVETEETHTEMVIRNPLEDVPARGARRN